MSTVQKQTTSTRTVTQQSTETTGVSQTSTMTSRQTNCVQITKRGMFFDDSFFEDTRNDFRHAVSDVVAKFGDKTSSTDELTQYRSLRSQDLRDENQAIMSSEDDRKHKIVVDVQDFVNGGEINVKVVEEREVVVEGHVKRVEGNRTSSKSFQRSFILPEDVDVDTLSSVMSADGVLTITATKIVKTTTQQLTQIPVSIQKIENKKVTTTTTSTTGVQETPAPQPSIKPQEPAQDETVSIQKVTKITKETTTTSDSSAPQTPEKPLPIAKKGDFFNDSFFEDKRQDFQTAVHEVLKKMNIQTTTTNELSTYRDLRQRELKEETQAATSSEDQNTHKIVVDVQDFVNGEITVKIVNEREIIIEGHIERKEGNTTSKKSFKKRFILPEDIEVEKVTSVMSSDGVLTITTPKKPSTQQLTQAPASVKKIENKKQETTKTTTAVQETSTKTDTKEVRTIIIIKKGNFFSDTFFEDIRQTYQKAVTEILQKLNIDISTADIMTTYRSVRQRELKEETQVVTEREDQQVRKFVVDVQDFANGGDVTVKVVKEKEVVVEGKVDRVEGGVTVTKRFTKTFILTENIEVTSVTAVMSADGVLTITAPKKTSQQKQVKVEKQADTEKKTPVVQQQKPQEDRVLPVDKKGSFFSDSYFQDSRQDFQSAITEVVTKFEKDTKEDHMTVYRKLRQKTVKLENQAVSVKEDSSFQKIVMDVQDFMNGNIKVMITSENILVVEGKGERRDGAKISSHSFLRRFIVPDDVIPESIQASLSSDGVLTIFSKKQ